MTSQPTSGAISSTVFGTMPNGQVVKQFCLTNKNNITVEILNLGGIIRRWLVPSSTGVPVDIVLGYDTLQQYLADDSCLGALVGRYANRINKGQFSLDGKSHQLDINLGENCLHGGSDGFNRRVWTATILTETDNPTLQLTLSSPGGDQGFPGNINVTVIYTLTEQNQLQIEYFAKSEQNTVYNPTNHTYFNLAGHNSGSVKDHKIQILASHYTPINEQGIPTGEISSVEDTPLDLRELSKISTSLASNHPQIQYANGLDNNLCLDTYEQGSTTAKYSGQVICEQSKIGLNVFTSMPGMQVFTANHFVDKVGKNGAPYQAQQGVCFESQFYPDSPNNPHFPSATLKAGVSFYSVTVYEVFFKKTDFIALD